MNIYVPSNAETLKAQKTKVAQIIKENPGYVPIACHKTGVGVHLQKNARTRFLFPADKLFSVFQFSFRKELQLDQTQSIFFFTLNNHLISQSSTVIELYNRFKSEDDVLHLLYTTESTFG